MFKVIPSWRLSVRALGVQVVGREEQSRMRFCGAWVASVSILAFILGHSGAGEASPLLWIGTWAMLFMKAARGFLQVLPEWLTAEALPISQDVFVSGPF